MRLYGPVPSCMMPPLPDPVGRLGALPANMTAYRVGSTSQIGYPNQANSVAVGAGYVPPTFVPPVYPDLQLAPSGSQGNIDFPYTIKQPAWTGNFFWWTGGGVINIGYPRYSNDALEFLRFAVVDSNWDDVLKWFEWAAASYKWSYQQAQTWDFGAFRWIAAKYAPAGTFGTILYTPNQYLPQPPAAKVAAPAAAPVSSFAPAVAVTVQPIVTGGRAASSGGKLAGLRRLGSVTTLTPAEIAAFQVSNVADVRPGQQAFVWWSLADLNTFARSMMKYANKAGTTGKCLDSVYGNWAQYWANALHSQGGPKGFGVTLGTCPVQDNFWQGFGLFVAEVVLIYVGGAYIAPAIAGAAGGGTAAAETGVAAVTDSSLAADTGALLASNVAVGVADTAIDTAVTGSTLAEFTVTATPIVTTGLTVAETGAITGAVAAAGAAAISAGAAAGSGAVPSQSVMPTNADVQPSNLTPQIPDTPPPTLPAVPPVIPPGAAASGGSLVSQATQGANLVKSIVGAGAAISTLLNPPSATPIHTVMPPGGAILPSGSASQLLTGTTFGVSNLAWLALGGLGIVIATRRKKRTA